MKKTMSFSTDNGRLTTDHQSTTFGGDMSQAGINFVKYYPDRFLAYLKANDYPVYHKSNIFFRDFQYGLWKFLKENQTKVSYEQMERIAREIAEAYEEQGIFRKINRQSYEVNLPAFATVFPTAGFGPAPTAPPPKAPPKPAPAPTAPLPKPAAAAPAPKPAAAEAPDAPAPKPAAAAPASAPGAASMGNAASVAAAAAMSDQEKAAKIEEMKRKMEEAKARRLAGG
jgi:hypothetical protein